VKVDVTPRTPEDFARAEWAAAHEEAPLAEAGPGVRTAAPTPEQAALAARAERIMRGRALQSGRVVKRGVDRVWISYTTDGKSRIAPFPTAEVFFFSPAGELNSGSDAPWLLERGARVLVPAGE
jgi:hypothetical protein